MGTTHITLYGEGNRFAQAKYLRDLAFILEREGERDGDIARGPIFGHDYSVDEEG